ncbi:cytochrome b/b6 domain-containing protein [Lutimaribacter saemankumensis]|uniref:Cytochrome b n=1 Tax=Lutimaribacter saemankumensis TaxID=490829 RepID=A0A1G8RYI8_9RHOB|nr:cytochrome b/b6 domain-containing protein [Lutimaribacter saemankumensis]SDJ22019.1 Cytochrome b [Lutimaribacter saemankumensis]
MVTKKVWDPLIRVFHWTLVGGFVLNALIIDEDSKLHEQIGWVIVALLSARLVWGLIGSRHARFSDFLPSFSGAIGQLRDMATGRVRHHLGHSPLGAWMIWNLLVGIAAISLTGWMMTTATFWGVDWVEELHEVLVVWVGLSAGVHVVAVIVESCRTGVNLPRAMVTGSKVMPDDAFDG